MIYYTLIYYKMIYYTMKPSMFYSGTIIYMIRKYVK